MRSYLEFTAMRHCGIPSNHFYTQSQNSLEAVSLKDFFDTEYESMRLNQLSKQCLSDIKISGEVYFGAINEENRLDFASWFFDEPDQEKLENSGYKDFLMNLLDSLIIYRSNYEQEFSRAGIVTIKDSHASIKWVKDGEAETLADIKKSTYLQ